MVQMAHTWAAHINQFQLLCMALQVLYKGSTKFERTPEVLQLLTMGVIKPAGWADLQLMGLSAYLESAIPLFIAAPLLGTALIRDTLAELPPDLAPPPPDATTSVR